MPVHHWPESRFTLERSFQSGMFLRRRKAETAEARGTILYIHGLGESALCYEAVVSDDRLATWNHVAPDLLGYGRSSWSAEPTSVEQHAESLAELVDSLGLQDVILLGHSMGGVIGCYLTQLLGSRVSFFLNVEGNVTLEDCGFSSRAAGQSQEDWLAGGYARFVDSVYTLSDGSPKTDSTTVMRAYAASVHFADPRTLLLNSEDLVRESKTETLARRYAELNVPMVYFHGRPRGTGGRSLSQLHQAGITTKGFEPAGHWPFLDWHDAFVDAILDSLP